jgi:hypothetical protein
VVLHRTMKADLDGLPVIEASAEGLGVRTTDAPRDIDVVGGKVSPGNGMSVFGDPSKMHPQRRPRALGGKSDLPLFGLDEGDLPAGLSSTPPRGRDTHMVVQPEWEMPIKDYEALLRQTRASWRRII